MYIYVLILRLPAVVEVCVVFDGAGGCAVVGGVGGGGVAAGGGGSGGDATG